MIRRVLIANRGEIALRVLRSCRELGLEAVAVYSEADRNSRHVRESDASFCIGPAPAAQSYLNVAAILAAARATGADAVHPGYGFLSENAGFAAACREHGLKFVGPSPDAISRMGNKLQARLAAEALGIPVVEGGRIEPGQAGAPRGDLPFPVMLKAVAGGGGRGMRIARDAREFASGLALAQSEAQAAFGDGTIYWESYIPNARHIEVQVLGDEYGNAAQIGERDCSAQRRHQKLVEESPSVVLTPELRGRIADAAVTIVRALRYEGAGTIEFLFDRDRQSFHFLEMNTRIQVEHPVTEMVAGVDLVREQLRIAAGETIEDSVMTARPSGHAIECRINAEDPAEGFRPSPGLLDTFLLPGGPGVRVDTHCVAGAEIPPFYDSLIAKLIVHAPTREQARRRMIRALGEFHVSGVRTTIPFHLRLMEHPDFVSSSFNTAWVDSRPGGLMP